jgi:hypothetical protein
VQQLVRKPTADDEKAKVITVTDATLDNVERVLREAGEPVNRAYIMRQLKAAGASTTPPRLNKALGYFAKHDMIVEGARGIQWTHNTSKSLQRAVAIGRRL